jgi:hypothetical protein
MILSPETLREMYDDYCDAVECYSVAGQLSYRTWLEEEIFDGFIFRHRDGSLNDIDEHQAFCESFESMLKEK